MPLESPEKFRITSLSFSYDGSMLAVAGNDLTNEDDSKPENGRVVVFDIKSGKIIKNKIFDSENTINSIAFSPMGGSPVLAVAENEGFINLWFIDFLYKNPLVKLDGRNMITSVTFTPEGRLVSGDIHGNIKIWNIWDELRDPILTLKMPNAVFAVAVSKDGNKIAATSPGFTTVWKGK